MVDLETKIAGNVMNLHLKAEKSGFKATNYTNIQDYKMGTHLGNGAFGAVFKAIHKATEMQVAIKSYEKVKLTDVGKIAVIKEI